MVSELRNDERVHLDPHHGYEGEACGKCGNFTLVRNGKELKCDTCGSSSQLKDSDPRLQPHEFF